MQLWGEFNAKVLLMEEDVDGNKTYNVVDVDDAGKVGSKYGKNGIVLDDVGNDFSRNADDLFKKGDQDALKEMHNELDKLDDVKRADKIRGRTKSERVSLRKEVEEKIWAKAEYNEELGQFIDPNFDTPIANIEPPQFFPEGHPHAGRRKPRADIGHISGEEWRDRLKRHKEKGHTREQIIEAENNADLYEIQDRTYNRSHITEQ